MSVVLFPEHTGATFSPCRYYRYTLWRTWDTSKPACLFLMLNPSTADETDNDPTVERCQRRAVAMGYGGLVVCNIFAYRSTDPGVLYTASDPVGPDNDVAIVAQAQAAGLVVCGWGTHGALQGRGAAVLSMLRDAGVTPHALRINRDGSPQHPLYVGYARQPFAMPTRWPLNQEHPFEPEDACD
ncbi:MAG: DUF1643 domain-containing protein [Thiomonas arsenitoxydans]|jgi:hypothetical protein|nr:DUF1643 domain-containing protein [Thiomonas arsenitoxydans]